jgi:hypothetical protein
VCFRMLPAKQAVLLCALLSLFSAGQVGPGQADPQDTKTPAPAQGNALCYTCHLGLQHEDLTARHAVQGVTCMSCHGPSVAHMHDEMQVTRPDRLFGRGQVDDMCGACHAGHTDAAKVEVFRDEWLGKTRPNGRVISRSSICTDCHGTHNYIAKPAAGAAAESPWLSLFNGHNLEGWQTSDAANWSIRAGRLTAVADASGPGHSLVTQDEYGDFRLSITYRAHWPVEAWVSLRQTKDACGPSVALGDSGPAPGRPGSIWLSQRTPALANLRENTVDRLTWNTLRIEARQNQYSTWLNGEEIGRVRLEGPARGKIAIRMAPHAGNQESWLQIREIQIQRLDKPSGNKNESTSGDMR